MSWITADIPMPRELPIAPHAIRAVVDQRRTEVGAAPDAGGEPGGRLTGVELDLVRRARDGDRDAFAELYTSYAPMVHGVLVAHAGAEEARDLVHEVFVLVLRSIARLEDPDRFAAWIFTIARNRGRDALKRRGRTSELDLEREPAVDPVSAHDDEEAARTLLDTLRSLPECYRETLSLRLVEGLSGPEIAARTGLTHGSVRVNLFRGMQLLREKLARSRAGGES